MFYKGFLVIWLIILLLFSDFGDTARKITGIFWEYHVCRLNMRSAWDRVALLTALMMRAAPQPIQDF